jgi:hypothetical protein
MQESSTAAATLSTRRAYPQTSERSVPLMGYVISHREALGMIRTLCLPASRTIGLFFSKISQKKSCSSFFHI